MKNVKHRVFNITTLLSSKKRGVCGRRVTRYQETIEY